MTPLRSLLAVAAVLALSQSMHAADAKDKTTTGPVSYYKDVRRVFQQHCQGCHQPARPMGGYVMTSHAELLKSGDRGQAGVVPGKPEASVLIEQITPKNDKASMPKGKPPLKAEEIELVVRWIKEGAKDDTPKATIDTISEKNPPVYKSPPVVSSISFSPDGKLLAVSGYHEALIHKADGSEIVARFIGLAERIQSLAFSPDGKSLAIAGGSPGRFGEVQVWDVEKKKLRYSVSFTYDTLYGVSWSPDSSKIAFGCSDNSVRAIEASSGKQILYQGAHADWVLNTVFSQDGEHLVSVSRDMSMKLTVVSTQRFVDNVTSITPGDLKGGLTALDRRPLAKQTKVKGVDNAEKVYDELIVGGSDGKPRLYQMHRTKQRVIGDDYNRLRDEYKALPGRLFAMKFNKDGSRFVACSSLDGKGYVRVFETDSTKEVSKLEGIGSTYAVEFSPDGKTVASAGFDGNVVLSDPATGKVLNKFVAVPLAAKK